MSTITQPRAGLYLCNRTSSWSNKPCDEAIEIEVMCVDTRGVDNPAKLTPHDVAVDAWYGKGTNHRVVDGCIHRDFTLLEWAVEIPDMASFLKEHGQCVVSVNTAGYLTIEIYDNYRE